MVGLIMGSIQACMMHRHRNRKPTLFPFSIELKLVFVICKSSYSPLLPGIWYKVSKNQITICLDIDKYKHKLYQMCPHSPLSISVITKGLQRKLLT